MEVFFFDSSERLVQPQAHAQCSRANHFAAVDGHEQRCGNRQVRGNAVEHGAFAGRLAHEAEVSLPQIAQPAVDQLGGAAARTRGKVPLLDQSHSQPP